MKRRENRKKGYTLPYYLDRKHIRSAWERHWEIIVTAILALIIGIIFIPMIFR